MPLTARCRGCGYVLYNGSLMPGRGGYWYNSPAHHISKKHEGRCPNCDRALEPSEARVTGVYTTDEP